MDSYYKDKMVAKHKHTKCGLYIETGFWVSDEMDEPC